MYNIDLATGKAKLINGYEGLPDSAAILDGKLYFSDWKAIGKAGIIAVMDLKTGSFEQVVMPFSSWVLLILQLAGMKNIC